MHSQKEDLEKYPLTKAEAEFRKNELLSDLNEYFIQYNLILTLRKSTDKFANFEESNYVTNDFEGRIKVIFDYFPKTNDNIFLNYHGSVISVTINGKKSEINHQRRRIFLDKSLLVENSRNEVIILFSSLYNHSGAGLHQFIDPSDKNEYYYSQFESFDCNTVFPVFDQPDIKAKLSISLSGSKSWELLSNENENFSADLDNLTGGNLGGISQNLQENFAEFLSLSEYELQFLFSSVNKKDYKLTSFLETEKISCYLYAICAGPYFCHNDESNYKVPLRIFMRQSLKDCANPQEFFKITIAGMEWYHKFFGYAYPFRKYDQIYCPEYNYGAMENVGLVTYTEVYCWRENPTNQLKNRFSITALHELAHMWFGNFVTMKWWDDLWLNESFATFISFLCQSQALQHMDEIYHQSWLSFNGYKDSAYREDQNTTTHSVYSDILDTEMAHANFDAIVYYKGSSLLKQMFYFIGEKNFSKGLNSYFTRYMWNNTVFDNFVDEMVKAVSFSEDSADEIRKKFDLKELSRKWLTEPGLNQVELLMEDNQEKISQFKIKQTPCLEKFSNLQTHLMDVLFVYENSRQEIKNVVVYNQEISEVPQVIGLDTPSAVVLNYNDYSYVKWIIDANSFIYFKKNLHKNLDLLSRKLVYRSLYDAVRDAKISCAEYIQTISEQIIDETEESLIINNLNYLQGAISHFLPVKFYLYFSSLMFDLVSKLIKKFINQKASLLSLIQTLISFAVNPEHTKLLQNWLFSDAFVIIDGEKQLIPNELISQDNRFAILAKVYQLRDLSTEDKTALLENEKVRDKFTDKSTKAELTCRALIPDIKNKEEIWDKIINQPKSESLHNMRALMMGFAPITQLDLVEEFLKKRFFTDIYVVAKNEYFFIDYFLMFCSPDRCIEEQTIENLLKITSEMDSSQEYIRKKLMEMIDDVKRYLRAQTFCEFKMAILNKWDK